MAAELSVASIGARAARLLGQHADWHVEAVFDRSFYLRAGDEFICVGEASIGDGPLNALLGVGGELPRLETDTRTNLDTTTAKLWHEPLWPVMSGNLAPAYLSQVTEHALQVAAAGSFVHAVFSAGEPNTALARRARAGANALRDGLHSGNASKLDEAAALLLGLGPGLTPSGDDVLAGALVMLYALRCEARALGLARQVSVPMPPATSPLSCALLRAACDGEPSAAMHQSISAMMGARDPAHVTSPLQAIGETSGFDMLAGVLVVAEIQSRNL